MIKIADFAVRLTRGVVLRRTLPSEFDTASLYVSSRAGLRYLYRPLEELEPTLLRLAMLVAPGNVVWDVGAGLGMFSVAAAVRAGPGGCVVAFEPQEWCVALLRRTASTRQPGSSRLMVAPLGIANAVALQTSVLSPRIGGTAVTGIVATFNLDLLLNHLPAPHVLKIDSAAELDVLSGQSRMLETIRPTIVCKVAPLNVHRLSDLLRQAEYVLYDAACAERGATPMETASSTTIALPSERRAEVLVCSWRHSAP